MGLYKNRCVIKLKKMNTPNDFSIGLSHEFVITVAKVGWSPEQLSSLTKNQDLLKQFLGVINKTHKIVKKIHVIDCNVLPLFPESGYGWKFYEGPSKNKFGLLSFNPEHLEVFHCSKRREDRTDWVTYMVDDFHKESLNGLPANVLDYLLGIPELIPEDWKNKSKSGKIRHFVFVKTQYVEPNGIVHYRDLYYEDNKWKTSTQQGLSHYSDCVLIPYLKQPC
jgi:hypothetical protein